MVLLIIIIKWLKQLFNKGVCVDGFCECNSDKNIYASPDCSTLAIAFLENFK